MRQSVTVGSSENESLENCRKSKEIFSSQLAVTPDNEEFGSKRINILQGLCDVKRQAGISYLILAESTNAELEPQKRKDLYQSAVPHFAEAVKYARQILEKNPDNANIKNDLMFSRLYGSTAGAGTGETEKALKTQFELLDQAKKLSAEDPQNVEGIYDVFRITDQIAQTSIVRKYYPQAFEKFAEGEKILADLAARDQENAEAQADLSRISPRCLLSPLWV